MAFWKKQKKLLNDARQDYSEGNYYSAIDKLKVFLVEGTVKRREKRAYLLLGESYEKIGEIDSALNTYLEGVELNPKDKDLLLKLGALYQRNDLIRDSIEIYERILALDKNNSQAFLGLARAYTDEGFFSKAEGYFQQYLRITKIEDFDGDIFLEHAGAYFRQRKYNEALFNAALSIDKLGENKDNTFLVAKINRMQGNMEDAYIYIDKAINLEGYDNCYTALLTKALWLTQDKRYEEAKIISDSVLLEKPNNRLALYVNFLAYRGKGNKNKADEYLKRISAYEDNSFISRVARTHLSVDN